MENHDSYKLISCLLSDRPSCFSGLEALALCCKIKESRRTTWQAHEVEHVFVISVRNKWYDILAAINTSAAENSTRDCLIKTVAMYVSWFVGLVKAHFYVPYLRFHINCEVTTIYVPPYHESTYSLVEAFGEWQGGNTHNLCPYHIDVIKYFYINHLNRHKGPWDSQLAYTYNLSCALSPQLSD